VVRRNVKQSTEDKQGYPATAAAAAAAAAVAADNGDESRGSVSASTGEQFLRPLGGNPFADEVTASGPDSRANDVDVTGPTPTAKDEEALTGGPAASRSKKKKAKAKAKVKNGAFSSSVGGTIPPLKAAAAEEEEDDWDDWTADAERKPSPESDIVVSPTQKHTPVPPPTESTAETRSTGHRDD
jgi:hypothetical protein